MKVKKSNKRGNILVNALLAITLSSIVLVNISNSTVRTAKLQNEIFKRDLIVSFMENVTFDLIPLVVFDFSANFIESQSSFDSSTTEFTNVIQNYLLGLDSNNVLECNSVYWETVGTKEYEFYLVCAPPLANLTYTIVFNVIQSGNGTEPGSKAYVITYSYTEETITV